MNANSPVPDSATPREAEILELLTLHLATVYQPGLGRELLALFGTVRAVLTAPRSRIEQALGARRDAAEKILSRRAGEAARKELERSRELGASLLAWGTPGYPAMMSELPGMPLVLFALGDSAAWRRSEAATVGIVGSRRPTPYGIEQSRAFSQAFVRRGLTVVSGLALGIDGEAHLSALEAGGQTIAVLGSGLGRIYPDSNRPLARRIVEGRAGFLVSELPCDSAPRSFHFPLRNRILSALSQAVLVVEAGEKSGSLITVTHALEQGKTVYALPGRVDRPEALGCLRLLQDGASLAITPDDVLPGVLEGAGPSTPAQSGRLLPLSGPFGEKLAHLFSLEDLWPLDALLDRIGAPAGELLRELGRLEMDGLLERRGGGSYARSGRAALALPPRPQ